MSTVKHERLEAQIQKALSEIIMREVKDPNVGFVTITEVKLTRDLSFLKVYIHFLGAENRESAGLKSLDKAKGFIRTELGKKVNMRKLPEISFHIDESMEYGQHIEDLLGSLKK